MRVQSRAIEIIVVLCLVLQDVQLLVEFQVGCVEMAVVVVVAVALAVLFYERVFGDHPHFGGLQAVATLHTHATTHTTTTAVAAATDGSGEGGLGGRRDDDRQAGADIDGALDHCGL